jgi:hypothetical protein
MTDEKVYNDFLKRELALEDFVVFPGPYNGGMKLGQIVKFTPQNVKIRWTRKDYRGNIITKDTYRPSKECVRVDGPDLTFYLLSGEY